MAKSISLKLDDKIFEEAEKIISTEGSSRNRYINDAVEAYNQQKRRIWLAAQFKKASKLVAESSMKVLAEFEALEDDYENYGSRSHG